MSEGKRGGKRCVNDGKGSEWKGISGDFRLCATVQGGFVVEKRLCGYKLTHIFFLILEKIKKLIALGITRFTFVFQ